MRSTVNALDGFFCSIRRGRHAWWITVRRPRASVFRVIAVIMFHTARELAGRSCLDPMRIQAVYHAPTPGTARQNDFRRIFLIPCIFVMYYIVVIIIYISEILYYSIKDNLFFCRRIIIENINVKVICYDSDEK